MSSAFPQRIVSKDDPEYLRWFRHILVLKSPPKGSSLREIAQFQDDFQSLLEAKTLADSENIIRSSNAGHALTLQDLKDTVRDIIIRNDADWVSGCVGMAIMHSPDTTERLVTLFANLPLHHRETDLKQMSICLDDGVYTLTIRTHENRFVPKGELCIWLVHPTEPAAEILVGEDGNLIRYDDIYAEKEDMEHFAVNSFCVALVSDTEVAATDVTPPRYEPLGPGTFPDFELGIRNEKWAVEVTRIESEMVAYFRLSDELDRKTIDKVNRTEVTDSKINNALVKALKDKTERLDRFDEYSRTCLLLVDIVDTVDPDDPGMWNGVDLSAYEVVALVRRNSTVVFVKGAELF